MLGSVKPNGSYVWKVLKVSLRWGRVLGLTLLTLLRLQSPLVLTLLGFQI